MPKMIKTKTKINLVELAEQLQAERSVVLVTHISPDIDGVGSMLALGRGLHEAGVGVKLFLADTIPKRFFFLSGLGKISRELNWEEVETVVTLDCGDLDRTGVAQELVEHKIRIINIDHHPQAEPFGDLAHVDDRRTSTAEIVYDLLQILPVDITKQIADMLLAGIVCDTQGFQVLNTSPRVLEIASELMRRGARMPSISRDLFRVKPLTALRLWGRVLDRVQVDKQTEMAYSVVRESDFKDLKATKHDLEGLIDLINRVSDSKFSLLLSEDGNNLVRGSLRSEEFKKVDVSKIAAMFGGGGHRLASGFKISGKISNNNGKWVIKQ